MNTTPRHQIANSRRAWFTLTLVVAHICSGPAAYALKAQAPEEGTAAVGLEEQLRGGAGAREHYIHTLEHVVVGDRLAMTVVPNQGASASRVAIAEPDGETTFMTRVQADTLGIPRLRFVDLATGQAQPIHIQGLDNPKALTYQDGIVYVVQSEGRLHRFEVARQEWLPIWTLTYAVVDGGATEESPSMRLAQPGGVAVDGRRGVLYVTDSEAGRIAGFRLSDGGFTGFLVTGLSAPEDVVVGPHPTDPARTALYVADRLRGTVFAYDAATGTPAAFSIPGLTNPARLAIDPEHRLLFVVSDHAGFLGGFSLQTGEKVELEIPETDAIRRYYEQHAADIDVDLAQAADVVYDPQTKAIILATHQRLIPFWVDGQRLRLTPPAAGLEEPSAEPDASGRFRITPSGKAIRVRPTNAVRPGTTTPLQRLVPGDVRILVVEFGDAAGFGDVVRTHLREWVPMEDTIVARSAEEATRAIEREHPQLVLTGLLSNDAWRDVAHAAKAADASSTVALIARPSPKAFSLIQAALDSGALTHFIRVSPVPTDDAMAQVVRAVTTVVDKAVTDRLVLAGLEEPALQQRQVAAVAALETLQRAAGAARVTAPTDRFYFLKDDAALLAPVFQRLGLRFLVRVETSRAAKALVKLGVPADRIAGALSDEESALDYQQHGVTRTAKAVWGDRRFLEAIHRDMDPWTAASVRTVQQVPNSDTTWLSFWHDWPVPDAVRAQLAPAVKATEEYFRAMG